jgi:anthranilate synthase component 1
VSGEVKEGTTMSEMMSATFPAGTLSGAPKYMAMKIIDKYESQRRGYYGGAIGFIDFRGRFNHAIMIRTFLSKANTLYYQAGAGIVAISEEENELQEVNNKLGALRKAIEMAEEIK